MASARCMLKGYESKRGQELGQIPGNESPRILIGPQPEVEARVHVDAGLPRCLPLLWHLGGLPGLVDHCRYQVRPHGAGIGGPVCDRVITCNASMTTEDSLPCDSFACPASRSLHGKAGPFMGLSDYPLTAGTLAESLTLTSCS